MSVKYNFFTRLGGVSDGIYASLNCGAGSNDAPDNINKNKLNVAKYFNQEYAQLCTLAQVHSPHVITLHAPIPEHIKPQADAMVTATPNLILGILTADCAPVLLYDEDAGVIGAAHAGWKGSVGGVIGHTITAMEALGAKRENISSMIGPCIGPESYEVSEDFYQQFIKHDANNAAFFIKPKNLHWHFNLPEYVAKMIVDTGAQVPQISGHDTCAMESEYFSYRRKTLRNEPDYGRQISAIMLNKIA
jgi:YfiH family protein